MASKTKSNMASTKSNMASMKSNMASTKSNMASNKKWIIMVGGTATGKTRYANEYVRQEKYVQFIPEVHHGKVEYTLSGVRRDAQEVLIETCTPSDARLVDVFVRKTHGVAPIIWAFVRREDVVTTLPALAGLNIEKVFFPEQKRKWNGAWHEVDVTQPTSLPTRFPTSFPTSREVTSLPTSLESNTVGDQDDDDVRVEDVVAACRGYVKYATLEFKYCSSCTQAVPVKWVELPGQQTEHELGPIIFDPMILETKEQTEAQQVTSNNEEASNEVCDNNNNNNNNYAAWRDKIDVWFDKIEALCVKFTEWYLEAAPGLFFLVVVNIVLFLVLRDSYVRFVFWSDSLPTYGDYLVAALQTVINTVDTLIWNMVEALTNTWQSIPTSFRRNVAVLCSGHEEDEEEEEQEEHQENE